MPSVARDTSKPPQTTVAQRSLALVRLRYQMRYSLDRQSDRNLPSSGHSRRGRLRTCRRWEATVHCQGGRARRCCSGCYRQSRATHATRWKGSTRTTNDITTCSSAVEIVQLTNSVLYASNVAVVELQRSLVSLRQNPLVRSVAIFGTGTLTGAILSRLLCSLAAG